MSLPKNITQSNKPVFLISQYDEGKLWVHSNNEEICLSVSDNHIGFEVNTPYDGEELSSDNYEVVTKEYAKEHIRAWGQKFRVKYPQIEALVAVVLNY